MPASGTLSPSTPVSGLCWMHPTGSAQFFRRAPSESPRTTSHLRSSCRARAAFRKDAEARRSPSRWQSSPAESETLRTPHGADYSKRVGTLGPRKDRRMTQTAFILTQPGSTIVTQADVNMLLTILAGGWRKSSEIAADYRWSERYPGISKDNSERRIRAIAAASNGQILSYPSSPGYRVTSEASSEEIRTALAKIRHQAREMFDRATQIETTATR